MVLILKYQNMKTSGHKDSPEIFKVLFVINDSLI